MNKKRPKRKLSTIKGNVFQVREDDSVYWKHPGGKLRELGPTALTTEELLAILISTGYKGKTALEVSKEILAKHNSLDLLSHQPLAALLSIKGLGDVKIIRIAAALELGRRTAEEILKNHGKEK